MSVKGLIVAGARPGAGGERALPELARVGNRPLLGHAVTALDAAGIERIAVAAPGHARPQLVEALAKQPECARVQFVDIDATAGAAGALLAAEAFLGEDPFVLHAGDGILRPGLSTLVARAAERAADALLLVYRNGADAATQLDGHRVMRLFSGALRDFADLSLAGAHVFGAGVLPRLRARLASTPEGDVATLAEQAWAAGLHLEAHVVRSWSRYTGDARDLVALNRAVLDDLPALDHAEPHAGAAVEGRVHIHPTATVEASVLRGPILIGAGARVLDAYVGPYTSVGDGAVVENAEIENSIVMEGARVQHLNWRLEGSVLGPGTRIHREFALPMAMRVLAPDGIDLTLP